MRPITSGCCLIALSVFLAPVRAADDAALREIIVKAIKAHGGANAIRQFKASVMKTKGIYYTFGIGVEFTGELAMQMPDRVFQKVDFAANGQKCTFIRVLDGDKGWQSFNGLTSDLSRGMITEAQEQQYAQSVERLIPLMEPAYQLSPLGETTIGGRPAIGVRVQREGHRPVKLYFGRESSLLLKSETYGRDPMDSSKKFTITRIYDNYKKSGDLMTAWKITVLHNDKDFVDSEVTDIRFVEQLDDKVFAKP